LSDDRRVGSENSLTAVMRALQLHGEQATLSLPATAKHLFQLFSRALNVAVQENVLLNAPYDVSRLLRLT
jgi:hypothetical protein